MIRIALVALAVGAGSAAAQEPPTALSSRSSSATITVGPNVQVSAARGGEAHYETHAAAHPTDPSRLVVGVIIYPETGRRGTIVYASRDGGSTWAPTLGDLENTGDPAVEYGPDGVAYYAALTLRGHELEENPAEPAHNWDGRKTLLYRSPDGGVRWEGPASFDFADREYVAVDRTGGARHGRVYVTGDPRPDRGFVVFTSSDGGRTFPAPGVEADVGGSSIGNAVVASDGTLIGVYAGGGAARAVTSRDGGRTLEPSVVVDRFVVAGGRKDGRHDNVNNFLHVAIDASGGPYHDRVYLTWPDRRSGHSEVYFAYSTDRGATWSESRVITDNPPGDTTDQFMPTLAVNGDGVVGLLWYDRRDNPDNRGYYPRFAASLDGGVTWTPSTRVSTAPYAAGPVSQRSAFAGNGGDTAGLVATADGVFHPVWVDDRTGVPQAWTAPVRVAGAAGAAPRVAAPSPPAGSLYLHPERIRLENGDFAEAERGVMFVPVNRSDPSSGVIGVEVYRFRASSAADPSTPPIFRLFGGPTFQGLEGNLSRAGYYEAEVRPFLDAADFVVVGQRGIGSSRPTTLCQRPDPVAVDAGIEAQEEALREAARRCHSWWRERGLDLSGFTALEAAADIDDTRRALGYDGIQIWGGSFGSHWGMALMRAYPHLVRRAVLRGLEGPDHTYDSPGGVLEALAGIAAAADTATALRGLIPEGGLLAAFKRAVDRAEADPVPVTVEDPVTGEPVTVRVDGDAVRAIAMAGGVAGWPANVLALHHGDYTRAGRALVQRLRRPGYQTASYFMLDCGSGITAERDARFRADTAVAYVGDLGWGYRTNCEAWPSDLGDEYRQNFETGIPTLMVHGEWDTSTPLVNALELAPYFTDSKLVLVEGGSHGALIQTMRAYPWFQDLIVEFFATGDMSAIPDTVTLPPVRWNVPAAPDGDGP